MPVYLELESLKIWLESRNWPRNENVEVITVASHEVWNLINKLENNDQTLLVKSNVLPLFDKVLQELEIHQKNIFANLPFNQSSLSETADALIKIIILLLDNKAKEINIPV